MKQALSFRMTVDVDKEDGHIIAVFFRVREGKSAQAREFANGSAFAHYNSRGELLGIELLGPCNITVLDKITAREPAVRKFIHSAIPREMAVA
jgi:hypothetical protein